MEQHTGVCFSTDLSHTQGVRQNRTTRVYHNSDSTLLAKLTQWGRGGEMSLRLFVDQSEIPPDSHIAHSGELLIIGVTGRVCGQAQPLYM